MPRQKEISARVKRRQVVEQTVCDAFDVRRGQNKEIAAGTQVLECLGKTPERGVQMLKGASVYNSVKSLRLVDTLHNLKTSLPSFICCVAGYFNPHAVPFPPNSLQEFTRSATDV